MIISALVWLLAMGGIMGGIGQIKSRFFKTGPKEHAGHIGYGRIEMLEMETDPRNVPHVVWWNSGEIQSNWYIHSGHYSFPVSSVQLGALDDGSIVWRPK